MPRIVIESQTVGGIPLLAVFPAEAQRVPLVFFIPGYGASRESGLSIAYRLAQGGCGCMAIDPLYHGARFDPRLFNAADKALGGIYPPETGLDIGITFYTVIRQCLADVRTLLAHFAADTRFDVTRCAVTGMSLGGYASYLVFANLPQMRTAVPMVGIPTFTRRWTDILDECACSNEEWAAALTAVAPQVAAHTALVAEMDPAERLLHAAPRALLIMNCDFDSDQPKHYAIEFYRELRKSYAASPEKLRLAIYPAGHTVTPEMERDAVAWIVGHLLEA
jgi:dienelactone hydrolase